MKTIFFLVNVSVVNNR